MAKHSIPKDAKAHPIYETMPFVDLEGGPSPIDRQCQTCGEWMGWPTWDNECKGKPDDN